MGSHLKSHLRVGLGAFGSILSSGKSAIKDPADCFLKPRVSCDFNSISPLRDSKTAGVGSARISHLSKLALPLPLCGFPTWCSTIIAVPGKECNSLTKRSQCFPRTPQVCVRRHVVLHHGIHKFSQTYHTNFAGSLVPTYYMKSLKNKRNLSNLQFALVNPMFQSTSEDSSNPTIGTLQNVLSFQ